MSAIQYYEDGKAISGDAPQTKASGITFDNTGTDLVSTNPEDAIKEVNGRTKHGVVELWANPSPSASSFAGQTINVLNYDTAKYDGIVMVVEMVSSERRLAQWLELDNFAISTSGWSGTIDYCTLNSSTSKIYNYSRTVSVTLSGTTLSITLSDGVNTGQNSIGTSATVLTDNSVMIPMKILGLIHNN